MISTKKSIVYCVLIAILSLFLITCASTPSQRENVLGLAELTQAIRVVSDYLNDNIPAGNMIVILNIQSESESLSNYIFNDLFANAVNDRIFTVVDRQRLDVIRAEQNFQLSGEVDDNTAIEIGRFFGAQTIVSGEISSFGGQYR